MKNYSQFIINENLNKDEVTIFCKNIKDMYNLENDKIGDFNELYNEFKQIDNEMYLYFDPDYTDKYTAYNGDSDYPITSPEWYNETIFRIPLTGFNDGFNHDMYIKLGMYRKSNGDGKLQFNYKRIRKKEK